MLTFHDALFANGVRSADNEQAVTVCAGLLAQDAECIGDGCGWRAGGLCVWVFAVYGLRSWGKEAMYCVIIARCAAFATAKYLIPFPLVLLS